MIVSKDVTIYTKVQKHIIYELNLVLVDNLLQIHVEEKFLFLFDVNCDINGILSSAVCKIF